MAGLPLFRNLSNIISQCVLMGNGGFGSVGCRFFQGTHSQSIVQFAEGLKPIQPSIQAVRTKVRCHFPRPKEYQRVRKHGWVKRLSTPGGRAIIMRRILKGRVVLSH